jgi:hypothetical protein
MAPIPVESIRKALNYQDAKLQQPSQREQQRRRDKGAFT